MIQKHVSDSVVVLEIDHGKVNAFDQELLEALEERLEETVDAGAVVITGSGRAFSAGVDLHRLLNGGTSYASTFVRTLGRVFEKVAAFPRPLIAAINGHAIAGGAILAASADLKLMSDGSGRIGAPELLVGVPFPAVALEILRFAWPTQHLQSLLYQGRTITCQDALALGIVDEIVAPGDLLEASLSRARQLASLPPETFALSKLQMRQPLMQRIESQKAVHEAQVRRAWADPSTLEVIRAYLERTLGK